MWNHLEPMPKNTVGMRKTAVQDVQKDLEPMLNQC